MAAMENHIEKILFTEKQISQRVSELASQITLNFSPSTNNGGGPLLSSSSSSAPVVVGVATGAFLFLADLVRKINLPISVDFVRVESYGSGTVSSGKPKISCDLKTDVTGKHVILVEDVVDTGNTLACLFEHLKSKGASSISVCTLLDKPSRRKVNVELVGEGKFYCGFECPDYFVVGYGLDFAEVYRNLPYVGILKPEMYS
ncbi:hypoxanthine-guanine phosphoribosyltransferase [Solanum tuberosum]|uniref:Hypoxanthine phosphoribosyltransferase n=1 Tax=Solanum tuberosum TaxID=4113 RepID=M1CCF5_SOLTU|nr:PREDICTED: hypoxanthine-guanine phosphoribosyltransferase [Solanum tuberosum]